MSIPGHKNNPIARDRIRLFAALAVVTAAIALGGYVAQSMRAGAAVDATTAPAQADMLYRVNINTAGADELHLLPGVGPSIAQRIVAARADGPFATPDDLGRVNGIGAKIIARLSPYIRFE